MNDRKKIMLHVIVECDWDEEEYGSVHPELILEDALIETKAGVKVYLNPETFNPEPIETNTPIEPGQQVIIPVSGLEYFEG